MSSWVRARVPAAIGVPLTSQLGDRIRLLAYPLISLIVVLLGSLSSDEVTPLVVLGFFCLALSLVAVWPNSTPLVRLTFAALVSHAAIGWITAEPSASATWVGSVGPQLYASAFFVVSFGLMVAGFGFSIGREWNLKLPVFDEERFRRVCGRLALFDCRNGIRAARGPRFGLDVPVDAWGPVVGNNVCSAGTAASQLPYPLGTGT